jgi:hypothetical protein
MSAKAACLVACMVIAANPGIARAQNPVEKVLVGDTKVKTIASYQGTTPLPKPEKILVYNFDVSPSAITMDDSPAARIHQRHLERKGLPDDSSPEVIAQRVQGAFSRTLVNELLKNGAPAEAVPPPGTAIPAHALVVRGDFTAIEQGDRGKRVMIGLGRGASDVQAHVIVSLTTDGPPIVLSECYLRSESGKKPGAAASLGWGSIAVAAATGAASDEKATVEADASRMAKHVAKLMESIMTEQHWIAPPPEPAK